MTKNTKHSIAVSISNSKRKIDHTGSRFGRLLVLSADLENPDKPKWICKCDCGNFSSVFTVALVSKKTQSCGCILREVMAAQKGNSPDRAKRFEWHGRLLTILQISKITNVDRITLKNRLLILNWSVEDAIYGPPTERRGRKRHAST